MTLAGKSVDVTFPLCKLEPDPNATVEVDGKRYQLQGEVLGRPVVADGFWGEFAAGYSEEKKAAPLVWKTKVFIFTRAELAEFQFSTGVRFRRGSLENFQMPDILGAVARWSAMVQASTGGAVVPEVEVEFDEDPDYQFLSEEKVSAYSNDFVQDTIGPRLNSSPFDVDDKVYRGPYHGVFAIHPARTDPLLLTSAQDTPVSAVSWYTMPVLADTDRLALTLFGSWMRQVTWRAEHAGFRVSPWFGSIENPFQWVANAFMPADVWPALLKNGTDSQTSFAANRVANPEKSWPHWVPLPEVTYIPDRVTAKRAGDKFWLSVPPELQDVFQARVAEKYGAKRIGRTSSKGVASLVYQPANSAELEKILGSGSETPLAIHAKTFRLVMSPKGAPSIGAETPLTEELSAEGVMQVEKRSDAEKGPIFQISERGFVRTGMIQLLRARDGGQSLSAKQTLEFQFRQTATDPMALRIDLTSGESAWVVLDIARTAPLGAPQGPSRVIHVPTLALNQWQTVKVNLSSVLQGIENPRVSRIVAIPAPFYEYSERSQLQVSTFDLTPPAFTDQPADSSPNGEAIGAGLLQRLQELVKAATTDGNPALLAAALTDPVRRVRATASWGLTQVRHEAAVPALLEEARSGLVWNALIAMQALVKQDTPAAWDGLKVIVDRGPFDHNRYGAILALAQKGDPGQAASLSLQYAARSWRVRQAAVQSLANIKSREAALIMTTFLRESEPVVRLAVAKSAPLDNDLVLRRIQYLAVNDPSEQIRLAAAVRMIQTSDDKLRREGLRLVKDESPLVRLGVVAAIVDPNEPASREALRIAVIDRDPRVRAAVLASLKSAKSIDPDEMANTFQDGDPRVWSALLDLHRAKKITLPAATLQKMRDSGIPEFAGATP